jgi:hypothetical protein
VLAAGLRARWAPLRGYRLTLERHLSRHFQ